MERIALKRWQLGELLKFIFNNSPLFFSNELDLLHNLWRTGCRYSDMIDIEQYSLLADGRYMLKSKKNNHYYTFEANMLTWNLRDAIKDKKQIYSDITYSTLKRKFNALTAVCPIFHKSKRISLHLFRHYRAKELFAQGYDIEYIKIALGEKTKASALHYVNSVLTTYNNEFVN